MKKLLVLMMIFGMTSLANALSVFDISVNGNPTPILDSGIFLNASDIVTLDIDCTSGYNTWRDYEFLALVTYPGTATISGGICLQPPAPNASFILGRYSDEMVMGELLFSQDGMLMYVDEFQGLATPPGKYFDEFVLHAEYSGNIIVNLYGSQDLDLETWRTIDSVVFNTPEPTTALLLGLGGLALIRKRRA